MNELIQKYESGEINIFELLESVQDVEYRLDGHGKFKSVSLKFKDGDLNSFFGVYPSNYSETIQPSEKTLQTIAEIYSKRLELMR